MSIPSTIILDPNGPHIIGGIPAKNLVIPLIETSPVVYLGCINKGEPVLEVLDFDLHLTCPIFLNLHEHVFLDHSIPTQPKLITENVKTDFSQYFRDIPGTTEVQYEGLHFRFDPTKSPSHVFINGFGTTGEPRWLQQSTWPNCPLTGRRMKFLFQIGDVSSCKTIIGQDILDKEYISPYLHFGHGQLYVFLEPRSKVVAYVNQVT